MTLSLRRSQKKSNLASSLQVQKLVLLMQEEEVRGKNFLLSNSKVRLRQTPRKTICTTGQRQSSAE
jgi:hypothetical protein